LVKNKKELQIIAPVGDVPSEDKHLQDRIKKLPSDAELSDVLREIGEWEKITVKKFREHERTKKSGRLTIYCK